MFLDKLQRKLESATSIHHGPYETIPPTASPGLLFLKSFLPAVDTLDPTIHPLSPLFTPNAPILICINLPSTASATFPLLKVRIWDINLSQKDAATTNETENNSKHGMSDKTTLYAPLPGLMHLKRTAMFEAMSSTNFRNDPDEFVVKVREFNILDLGGRELDDL
ncbi:unnamed protein product [Penicillium manginii]